MTTWRKSSYSGSQTDCVEIGSTELAVLVRDTKDRDGAVLIFTADTWRTFALALRPASGPRTVS